MDCSPPGSNVHGTHQARKLEWVAIPFSRGFLDPGIKHRSPTLQADSLPSELQGLKTLSKLGIQDTASLLQLIKKKICKRPRADIILNCEKPINFF